MITKLFTSFFFFEIQHIVKVGERNRREIERDREIETMTDKEAVTEIETRCKIELDMRMGIAIR